jgi:hypothetical protein
MTEQSTKKEVKAVQVTVDQNLSTATINGTKIEISTDSNVVVYSNEGVQTKPASTATAATTEDKQISIGKHFNTVAMYGAKVELATDGSLIVSTNGKVQIKTAAANDAAAAQAALILGQEMPDHSVYAGLTADGKQQIFAMPKDLDATLTFNDASKRVDSLNADKALGHNDWQIPALENLHVLRKNQNEGKLKGTFNTTDNASGSGYPGWYWSSTPHRDYPNNVGNVRFSDGDELWLSRDNFRLSCRPVRLLPVAAPSLG